MNEEELKIKRQVLEKIEAGQINMRPRFYFVVKIALVVAIVLLILLTSSLLISFIIFSLIASGKLFLLGFGLKGFINFFALFPWTLLLIEIVLIIVLEMLLKQFKLGYRSSLSTLVFVILCMSVLISFAISSTSFHNSLLVQAEKDDLPVVGDFYRNIRRTAPNQEIFRGVVYSISTSSFAIGSEIEREVRYTILIPSDLPVSLRPAVGDTVFVAGKLMPDNQVQAYGFRKIAPIPLVQ